MTDFDTFYKNVLAKDEKDGKFFEKIFTPWYLQNDPFWKSRVKNIWLFEDYPLKKT